MADERPTSQLIVQDLVDLLSDNDYTVTSADSDVIEAEDEEGNAFTLTVETDEEDEES